MMEESKSDPCKDFAGIALVCERCDLCHIPLQKTCNLMAMIKTLDLFFVSGFCK